MYSEQIKDQLDKLKHKDDIIILGIESSCDETSVAIVKNGRQVLSNVISSQIDIHTRFGGVVPEVASRNHVLAIDNVYKQALEKANLTIDDIDVISVTYGAGLIGALMVGVSFAKALAYNTSKPLIAVNHIRGHISANYLNSDIKPPFICLIVSGGHTAILKVVDYNSFSCLGSTVDDAIGEAFDKVARVIGLGYPGGPKVDKAASEGKNNIAFVTKDNLKKSYDCSYSGLKTAVINYVHKLEQKNQPLPVNDICASFTCEAVNPLIEKCIRACKQNNIKQLCLAGGVACNSYLRRKCQEECNKNGIKLHYPEPVLCTDNAAMIASCAYYNLKSGVNIENLELDAKSNLPL